MSRKRTTRLAYLMDSLGVRGKELADALHVDYSLVSKWKNNNRRLTERSAHLREIARHLLSIDEASNHQHIRRSLSGHYGSIEDAPYETLMSYLCRWLTETPPFEKEEAIVSTNKSQNLYGAHFDVYSGNHGRRCAVLRFLDYVLSLPAGQQLFLLSQEDMSWLLEDHRFLLEWRTKLAQVLRNENDITIIHTVDREFRDLSSILSQWLPLHMSGRIKSYFQPRYVDTAIKTTLFVVQNEAAIVGMTSGNRADTRYTAYFSDINTVRQSEGTFKAFLGTCRPLLTAYPTDPMDSLLEKMFRADRRPGNSYLLSDLPLATTMRRSTVVKVLEENNVDAGSIRKCLEYVDNAYGSLATIPQGSRVRHAYSLEALERAAYDAEPVTYPDLSLLCQKEIRASHAHFADHLSHVVEMLEACSGFEVALLADDERASLRDINLWIKENSVVVATTINAQRHGPFAVVAEESTVISAFCLFFDQLWNSMPRMNKEKVHVLERLKNLSR
jgi:transcriptional regulator with XRE-family HTH domain